MIEKAHGQVKIREYYQTEDIGVFSQAVRDIGQWKVCIGTWDI